MEIWPTDDRTLGASSSSQRKGKVKKKDFLPGYPCLEPGRLEAVTLIEKNGRFEWTSPVKYSSEARTFPRLVAGKPTLVYPYTCPPPLDVPRISIAQRAEQGAAFLRTYLPDVEVAAELVRDELARDAEVARDLAKYDPFVGNTLAILQDPDVTDCPILIAFPMGGTRSDLNVSCFELSETGRVCLKPIAVPVKSFAIPIQQIVLTHAKGHNLAAVRTLGSTVLLDARSISSFTEVQSEDIGNITREDVGQHPVVDIKFHSKLCEILAVNDQGSLHKCTFMDGRKSVRMVYGQGKSADNFDQFWQLASAGASEDGCLITSNKTVEELDFRAANTALQLLTIKDSTEMLTYVEDSKDDYLVRLSSTEQLLWLDRRFPGRALFGVKHHRQLDRTLGIHTLFMQHGQHTLLHSRKNTLVTVYDVSRSGDHLLQLHENPYLLPSNTTANDHYMGNAVFFSKDQISMFRLTGRGSIDRLDLGTRGDMITTQDLEWSSDVQALDAHVKASRLDVGPLGARRFQEADLRPIYDYIFRYSPEQADAEEQEQAEAVYELIDQIPSFWRQSEVPVEHILTLYDIVLRSGDEPTETSRADFLSGSIFNSTRGYRSLAQGRFPTESLRKDASWHYDISSILARIGTNSSSDIRTITDHLRSFDLNTEVDHPPQALRRQVKAREQLALDLALSTDIFYSRAISPPADVAEKDSEDMTQARRIDAEPPHVDFCYMQPTPKRDHYSKDSEGEEVAIPLGVRLLLNDWELGKDPERYVYKDSFGDDEETEHGVTRRSTSQPESRPAAPTTSLPPKIATTQHPPSIMASNSLFSATQVTFQPSREYFSQRENTQPVEMESQDFMASTQILPGPFGARPSAAGKRKPAKKRMGGF